MVQCGKERSDFSEMDTGAPQGDCSSAYEFTFYLTNTLKGYYHRQIPITDHDYTNTIQMIRINH